MSPLKRIRSLSRTLILGLIFLSLNSIALPFQDSIRFLKNGKTLFGKNCSACHSIHRENIGPLLASITKKRSKEWLFRFIKNSQSVIQSGDPYARFLYSEYEHVMPSFGSLSEKKIKEILDYIENDSNNNSADDINQDLDVIQTAQPDILYGRQLFQQQCASCHSLYAEHFGPALGSVTRRLPKEWLIAFIHNSQKVIADGDPYARQLFTSFDHRIMVNMEFINAGQIENILRYIEYSSGPIPKYQRTSSMEDSLYTPDEKAIAAGDEYAFVDTFQVLAITVPCIIITISVSLIVMLFKSF